MLIRYIKFDGKVYYGIVDSSKNINAHTDYVTFEYPFIKSYEVQTTSDGEAKTYNCVYLVDNNFYTYEDIMSMTSSLDADAWEKYLYVCEYLK